MGIFIQRIQKRNAVFGADGIPVQQRGHGLQGGCFPAVQNLPDVKPQQPLFMPFGAIQKHDLGKADQDDPPGRLGFPENLTGDDFLQSRIRKFLNFIIHGVLLRQEMQFQRIGIFFRNIYRLDDPEGWRAIGPVDFTGQGDNIAVIIQ